jgi:hypothetical protein
VAGTRDLAYAEDTTVPKTVPKNPHGFLNNPTSLVPLVALVSRDAQHQMGKFFASNGKEIVAPPQRPDLFEVPIAQPLPENLNFIP